MTYYILAHGHGITTWRQFFVLAGLAVVFNAVVTAAALWLVIGRRRK